MSNHNDTTHGSKNVSVMVRRVIFFVLLAGLTATSVFFTFRGLSSPRGMEQAQIGREIARGNGYSTKVIRPLTLWQMERTEHDTPSLSHFPETYHAPLNPYVYAAVLKAADATDQDRWQIPETSNIYQLDRVIAATCVFFFLIAVGINYALVARMFDTTIASVTVLLMVFCELMWNFSQSGLPQMLMLMTFSGAMFFLWRGIENTEENKSPMVPLIVCGALMCLLVLTHWIAVWPYIGLIIFTALYFKPRGVIAAICLGMLLLVAAPVAYILYSTTTGSISGTAFFSIHNGLGSSEDTVMRTLSPGGEDLELDGLILSLMASTLRQISDLHRNMGAILAAPLFFLALLHPFKGKSLSVFRWPLLLMWGCAGLGMSIYGLKDGAMDPNQIHILFAPLMAAYGLAMVSILWARLGLSLKVPALRHAHFVAIVAISAGPMIISVPKELKMGLLAEGIGGYPQWPPYYPKAYNRVLAGNTTVQDVIISDVPWATAWYGDRISVWLPRNLRQIEQIEALASGQGTPVTGLLISPYSYNNDKILGVGPTRGSYKELYPLVFNAWARFGGADDFIDSHEQYQGLAERYPHHYPLIIHGLISYYSKKPLVTTTD